MDEEILKRNTDCVYFLASPFTCKKGAECEYRHSEMARLNPRDCWYWLSGNCLNPTCPFRHPPLEGHNEGTTEASAAVSVPNQPSVSVPNQPSFSVPNQPSVSVPNQPSVSVPNPPSVTAPATKTTVPCYYYFSGYCSKGDRCHFLHESGDTSVWHPKASNAVIDAPMPPSSIKTSGKSEVGLAHKEKHPSGDGLSEMAMIRNNGLEVQQKQSAPVSAAVIDLPLKYPGQTFVPQHVQPAVVNPVSSEPAEAFTKNGFETSSGSDQSSEELIDGNVVRDEWWESSPGFDVLVDGQTEDGGYEDDLEYIHPHSGTDGDHDYLFMQREFVGQTEYDGGLLINGVHEVSGYLRDEHKTTVGRFSPRRRQDRNGRHNVSRKRKHRSVESTFGGCNNVDLRDYLSHRRMADQYLQTRDLRHDLIHRRNDRQEKSKSHATNQCFHGRLASKVEINGVWLDRRRTSVAVPKQQGRLRNSQHYASREHNGPQRRHHSAEGQSRSRFKRQRFSVESTAFNRLKSLPEIKEHKRRGYHSKIGCTDFDGPKPLSVILMEKKKITSPWDGAVTDCI